MHLTTTRNLLYFLERAASHVDATSGGNDGRRRLRTGNSLPVCHLKILYELYIVLVHAVSPGLNFVCNSLRFCHLKILYKFYII